jgi:hypothetical protein
MDVILDESALVPCPSWSAALRIETLASALKALDMVGCARVVRSVRDAADKDIGQGVGLRIWCFDRGVNRDAGKFVAQRLGKQPFIDGTDGLFAGVEGNNAIEGRMNGVLVVGLTFAALKRYPAVALGSAALPSCALSLIDLEMLSVNGERKDSITVCRVVTENDVLLRRGVIRDDIEQGISNGRELLGCADTFLPRLRFGSQAQGQISELTGTERVFRQLLRHLRALSDGAESWREGHEYCPGTAISWSAESRATLDHGKYGPLRDFPVPEGFASRRWSHHTKPSGGNDERLYFSVEGTGPGALVLIGYFGAHLPTAGTR